MANGGGQWVNLGEFGFIHSFLHLSLPPCGAVGGPRPGVQPRWLLVSPCQVSGTVCLQSCQCKPRTEHVLTIHGQQLKHDCFPVYLVVTLNRHLQATYHKKFFKKLSLRANIVFLLSKLAGSRHLYIVYTVLLSWWVVCTSVGPVKAHQPHQHPAQLHHAIDNRQSSTNTSLMATSIIQHWASSSCWQAADQNRRPRGECHNDVFCRPTQRLSSCKPLWSNMYQQQDIISQWQDDWTSAAVTNCSTTRR